MRSRFHGRVGAGNVPCNHSGCPELGEFRAPASVGRKPGFDGPGDWQWLCLDHVRQFNMGYDYFTGMSPDEIVAAQSPISGWAPEMRIYAAAGADLPPRWADFNDPLDAISSRFRDGLAGAKDSAIGLIAQERTALKTLGLDPETDLKAIRAAYSRLVRAYHPDRNGGDRSFEKKLHQVVEAYQLLKTSPTFAKPARQPNRSPE